MKANLVKPPFCAELVIALGNYYVKRFLSTPHVVSESWSSHGTKLTTYSPANPEIFNKDELLDEIFAVCGKYNYRFEAVSGTFFFYKGDSKWTYKITQETWPLAEKLK